MTDHRRWILREIQKDSEADVTRFEGSPMTGRTVAEYMGCQAAMIQALARIMESMLSETSSAEPPEPPKII